MRINLEIPEFGQKKNGYWYKTDIDGEIRKYHKISDGKKFHNLKNYADIKQ